MSIPLSNIEQKPDEPDIMYAIRRKDKSALERLISQDPTIINKKHIGYYYGYINNLYKDKYYPIIYAIMMNSISLVNVLLDSGGNIEALYSKDETPLLYAIWRLNQSPSIRNNESIIRERQEGLINIIKLLIKRGANVNVATSDGESALFKLAKFGNVELIKQLIGRGAKLNKQDRYGNSILHAAVSSDNVDLVKFLLEKGVNINKLNSLHQTPLKVAISEEYEPSNIDVIKFLIERGANVLIADGDRTTPLHDACTWHDQELVRLLLDKGAGPENTNNYEFTPLASTLKGEEDMIMYNDNNDAVEKKYMSIKTIIGMLREHGADINEYLYIDGVDGLSTPLLYSIKKQLHYSIKALIDNGADVNKPDGLTHMSPLELAVRENDFNTVKLLVEHGAIITQGIVRLAINLKIKQFLKLHYSPDNANNTTLSSANMPTHTRTTCSDPIMGNNNVNIGSSEYARFYIMNPDVKHIGCYTEDTLEFYNGDNKTFYKCKASVPRGALHVGRDQVEERSLTKLDFTIGSIYVYTDQFEKVVVNKNYKLAPTEEVVGRIASKGVVDGGSVVSADHCQTVFTDKIYKLYLLRAPTGGRLATRKKRGGARKTRRHTKADVSPKYTKAMLKQMSDKDLRALFNKIKTPELDYTFRALRSEEGEAKRPERETLMHVLERGVSCLSIVSDHS